MRKLVTQPRSRDVPFFSICSVLNRGNASNRAVPVSDVLQLVSVIVLVKSLGLGMVNLNL